MEKSRKKIKRSTRLIYILSKYGFEELIIRSRIKKLVPENWNSKKDESYQDPSLTVYERIRMALEELGPTYVKFGQVLSTIDIFPEKLIVELKKLQDKVEAEEIDIYQTIEEELGIDPKEYFTEINPIPIAAASISQVYEASLKDKQKVILKVKRSNIQETVESDLLLMKDLSGILESNYELARKINLRYIVDIFEKSIIEELSLIRELENIERFRKNFQDNEQLYVPITYRDLSNNNILCMEYISGIKISDKEEVVKNGFNPKEIALQGIDLYMKQIVEHGFFHADPHSGNIFLLKSGQIAFIDFGTMGTMMPSDQENIEFFLIHVVRKDIKKIIKSIRTIAIKYDISDEKQFEREIYEVFTLFEGISLKDLDLKMLMEKLFTIFNNNEILMPSYIYLLAKGIILIEGIGRNLSLEINIIECIKPYVYKVIRKKLRPDYLFTKGMENLQNISENVISIPDELHTLIKKTNNNELKLNYKIQGLYEINNTIKYLVMAIIIFALSISSSILVISGLKPQVFNIPWIAFIGFFLTGIFIILLILLMLRNRNKYRKE